MTLHPPTAAAAGAWQPWRHTAAVTLPAAPRAPPESVCMVGCQGMAPSASVTYSGAPRPRAQGSVHVCVQAALLNATWLVHLVLAVAAAVVVFVVVGVLPLSSRLRFDPVAVCGPPTPQGMCCSMPFTDRQRVEPVLCLPPAPGLLSVSTQSPPSQQQFTTL